MKNGYKCELFTSKNRPLFFLLKHTPPAPSVDAEELARWPRCCGVRNKIYPLGYTTYEYRCDERLKTTVEGSTRIVYTGLREGLEHLKIKTRLITERFASVMGEYVI